MFAGSSQSFAQTVKIGTAGSAMVVARQPKENSQTFADISRHFDTGGRWQQHTGPFTLAEKMAG